MGSYLLPGAAATVKGAGKEERQMERLLSSSWVETVCQGYGVWSSEGQR